MPNAPSIIRAGDFRLTNGVLVPSALSQNGTVATIKARAFIDDSTGIQYGNGYTFIDWLNYTMHRLDSSVLIETRSSSHGLPVSVVNSLRFRRQMLDLLSLGGVVIKDDSDKESKDYTLRLEQYPTVFFTFKNPETNSEVYGAGYGTTYTIRS